MPPDDPYHSIILISSGRQISRGEKAVVLFELYQKQKEERFQESLLKSSEENLLQMQVSNSESGVLSDVHE